MTAPTVIAAMAASSPVVAGPASLGPAPVSGSVTSAMTSGVDVGVGSGGSEAGVGSAHPFSATSQRSIGIGRAPASHVPPGEVR